MKKITLTILVLSITLSSFACPFCGCGVGNFYLGLLPDFQKRFIGLRYQYLPYQTHIKGDETQFSKDYYHTIELWGGISLGKKWQILGFIPYQINYQKTDDGIKKMSGISDVSALANYKLLDKTKMGEGRSTAQQLWIGGGIKMPTGKYHIDPNNPNTELGDVNSQAGTGSIDFLLNSSYNLRFNKIGINTSATYKINTKNNEDYQFGNRFNASSFVFYAARMKSATLSPNIGLLYQHSATNHFNNTKVDFTGGHLAMAAAGIELGLRKITIGGNVQLPFSQSFAAGQTEAKTRAMIHMSFSF
ncbi:hypothetical protein FRZ67_20920 [Panacibacter ginsenosidivorans]|uniref:Transporter n=1 Tax=Panacibacter ginsenosidivorans TaxID=1813871 RepID=A0A5B8VDU4_9BACT|nr:hypothetical protein [Panacibacter ginsenosidivorans]QEC69644.1 hypothetical protein FRZ67_20920 [Panacibacter ginsenosidivorans]